MDEWMDGRADGRMGWMDGWAGGRADGRTEIDFIMGTATITLCAGGSQS